MKLEREKFKTNLFYYYAQKYSENVTSDADIRNIDMTEEFWREIDNEIINEELIDINLNAKVRMSKSTIGIYISKRIYERMIKLLKLKNKEPFGVMNIARDQQEYSRIMRDDRTNFTVIMTDEVNELENTGENVSVERALNDVFSNVQAGRYVHRVSASPKEVADPNADIFLEVVSVDRKNKVSHTHLYYRMFKGGNEYMQLLGYVNFYVGDLIREWESVKKNFFKQNKTKYDIDKVNKARKEDFYVEYMIRKYEKMELITKEGIMRPRMLEYAKIILKVENKLRKLTRLNILNKGTIKNYVKKYCREHKIPTSIVGLELMTEEIDGILTLWKSYYKISKDKDKLDKYGEIDDEKEEKKELLLETMNDLAITIKAQLEELERYKEIDKEYNISYNEN